MPSSRAPTPAPNTIQPLLSPLWPLLLRVLEGAHIPRLESFLPPATTWTSFPGHPCRHLCSTRGRLELHHRQICTTTTRWGSSARWSWCTAAAEDERTPSLQLLGRRDSRGSARYDGVATRVRGSRGQADCSTAAAGSPRRTRLRTCWRRPLSMPLGALALPRWRCPLRD
jgi:hypothetical protein